MERRLAAILASDVVGYSGLIRADEEGTIAALKALRADLIDPKITEHHGRVVKLMGDGMLAEFASVVDAVRAAVATQQAVTERNSSLPTDQRIEFRVGINLGDVVIDGDDIQGDGVNVAARLEGLAEPGGVCISGSVHEQVRDRIDLPFEDLGEQKVKNIARPVQVWKWLHTASTAAATASADRSLPLPDKPSIAVLPFDNMSGDPEQEYFADGVTEDIITGLAKFRQFVVIGRNSTFTYKGMSVDARDVARDLGAQYVLQGSVRKSDNRVRITAQLVEAVSLSNIWAENFDRDLEDVFRVQDEITERIIGSVAPEYLSAEMRRAQRKESRNIDAWDAYMRGYWHLLRYGEDDNAQAKVWLEKAIKLDPVEAEYHGLLAVAHTMDYLYGWSGDLRESLRLATECAERGLALDGQDPIVIRSLGIVHFHSREHVAARECFERAVAVNPDDAETRALLGSALAVAGDYAGAVEQIEYAIHLSPRDAHMATWNGFLAIAAVVDGRDEVGATWAMKAIQANPQFPGGYRTLASCYGNLGRIEEAVIAVKKLQELLPQLTIKHLRARLPYFRKSTDKEHYLDGLREAGLPE